ncbi:MAG TPA: hypothetical protein DDW27_04350 [Bacteroidales bacterium]|nr:hypothetical protein [Bacteroidales bacterium]
MMKMKIKRIKSVLFFLICITLVKGQEVESEKVSIIINPRKKTEAAKPRIQIISPSLSAEGIYRTSDPRVELIGRIENVGEAASVIVKNEKTETDKTGIFKVVVWLEPGINEIPVIAFDNKNNRLDKRIRLEYETPEIAFINRINEESVYYGLIIAVNNYQDQNLESLDRPVNDAEKLYDILVSKYTFDPGNVKFLRNAVRQDIINALDELTRKVTQKDNLLIFYAGHGVWNDKSNVGYWLPSDARLDSRDKWFPNSTLVDYLSEIRSKHTLLIADACFGGSIFKSRNAMLDRRETVQELYNLTSRKAMTSGTLTKVPDRSAFTKYLIEKLSENNESAFTSEKLFSSFQTAVENNSDTKPRYGVIVDADDQGGEFVFIKK